MAPEILSNDFYNFKVDVWSVAVVIYIMLSGDMPFYGDSNEIMLRNILRKNLADTFKM